VIQTGDVVISGCDVPGLGLVKYQSYELKRVYWQGLVGTRVVKRDVANLDDPLPPSSGEEGAAAALEGAVKYLVLYSPQYHGETGPVVATRAEVELVTLADEVLASVWLAVPGLFWVWLCVQFYQYGVATGRM